MLLQWSGLYKDHIKQKEGMGLENNSLQDGPVFKVLLKLIVPSFITVVVSSSYSIVDGIFIGRKYGIAGNSTFSYIFILYSLVFSIACLICQGAPSLLAIKMGENDVDGAEKILGSSICSSVIIAVIQAVLIYAGLKPMIKILGCSEVYTGYIMQYFQVFLFFAPIYFVNHTLLYCLRSQGIIKLIFICNIGACLVNVILDPIFIIVLNGGFKGAAFATILANFSSMLFCIWCYTSGKAGLKIRIKYIKPDLKSTIDMIAIGGASFLTNLLYTVILVYYNKMAKFYGSIYGLAALSINSTIYKYLTVIMNAITVGMQPVICFNYGGKKYNRVLEALKDSMIIGMVISTICYVVVLVFANQIVGLFNSESGFIIFGGRSLRLVLLCLPLQVFYTIGVAFFQFIGKGKIATRFVFLRQVVFQIPIAFLLTSKIGVNGLWHSFWISDLLSFVILALFLIYEVNCYRKRSVNSVS